MGMAEDSAHTDDGGKSDHNHREAAKAKDGDVARVQMGFHARWCRGDLRG